MSAAARKAEAREAAKVRRQKIFIGIGGGLLLVVVGVQVLPALLGGSGSGSSQAAVSATPAVAITRPSSGASGSSPLPRSITRLKTRDVFIPQVSVPANAGAATVGERLVKGPPVRLKNFVTKDLFIPQVKPPTATPASTAVSTPNDGQGSGTASPGRPAGGGYIIVLTSIPGINAASQQAAARALVAARNAGLKDVVANDSVPGTSGAKPHFTVYTGPYEYQSSAQTELVRALRNGYPHAVAQQLPSTSGKGF